MKKTRRTALALGVIFIFTVILSFGVIALGVHHDCVSGACEICVLLGQWQSFIKNMSEVLLFAFGSFVLLLLILNNSKTDDSAFYRLNLTKHKVKLSI